MPVTTVSGGSSRDGGETFVENATVGVWLQQQVGWNNRVFVTAGSARRRQQLVRLGIRRGELSEIECRLGRARRAILEFRFHGSAAAAHGLGRGGPAARHVRRLASLQSADRLSRSAFPGARSVRQPALKPERSKELELGFDATLLKGRLDLVYTRYQRSVIDAIVNKPLAPSTGFTGSQIVNIGELASWGNELGMIARLVQRERFGWEVDAQFATIRNEIKSLGGLDFIGGAGQAQNREGYSIGDFFMRRILSAEIDANGVVLSSLCDGGTGPDGIDPGGEPVPCANAPRVWWGRTQPTWTFAAGTTFTLFDNVMLHGRVEGYGGHLQANTEIRATHNQVTSAAVLLRNDPILQATRVLENDATGTYKAGFLRLREITAAYDLPALITRRVGANSGALSIGMRNVAMLWTAEHGWGTPRDGSIKVPVANRTMITWDPEVRSTGQAATGYQTVLPPAASVIMSLRLSF